MRSILEIVDQGVYLLRLRKTILFFIEGLEMNVFIVQAIGKGFCNDLFPHHRRSHQKYNIWMNNRNNASMNLINTACGIYCLDFIYISIVV